jgi:hypothetical protein
VPPVVTPPVEETTTWVEVGGLAVSTYATAPLLPAVTSWLVKAAEADVVTEAVVGADWVIVTAVTVSVKLHAPVSEEVSESVPVTA